VLLAAIALAAGLLAAPAAQAAPVRAERAVAAAPASRSAQFQRSCAEPIPGRSSCFALRRTDVVEPVGMQAAAVRPADVSPNVVPAGLGPSSLQSAYNLPSATAGAGQTVAVINAHNHPNAEADLAVYRAQYGLPACTTANGCFRKVNQNGLASPLPSNSSSWSDEISLDLDMVSATCPNCNILLVEAANSSNSNLYAAVNRAVTMGAKFISNSWGNHEYASETTDESVFNHPGVAITASTGDDGTGSQYPATSRFVTAVGGTSLVTAANSRGWAETAWSGAGSGCSSYISKPVWQTVSTGCANRAEADVSAVADPATGVAVYQTYGANGWTVYGGTSVASPIIASIYALAGAPAATDAPASFPYASSGSLNDVTIGTNGLCGAPLCTAGTGWDGPTGLGTPNGTAAFAAPATPPTPTPTPTPTPAPNTVSVTNPGAQTATVGTAFSLQIAASDSAPSQTLTFTATGLPAGLSISSAGLITGTPTTAGTFSTTVTATDSTNATGSATFSTTVSAPPNTVAVTNPGEQTATVGTAFSLQIAATDSSSTETLAFTATGLPAGLSITPAGLISGTPTTAGTFSTTVTATDSTSVTGTATFSITVSTPVPVCTGTQLLGNPGFETGTVAPWTTSTGVITSSTAQTAHTGSYYAWLDGYGSSHTDTLSQSVTIPAACTGTTLSFWLKISTAETTSSIFDTMTVKIGSTTLATYSNADHAGYLQKTFSLAAYAGQTVTLTFTGVEDASLQTSFLLDDTAITTS
jgi:hypothetical protein